MNELSKLAPELKAQCKSGSNHGERQLSGSIVPGSRGVIKDKEHANRTLRFGIAVGQGHICRSSAKGRLQLMLIMKERLEESGWVWQARILENWIHRLQPKRADLSEREREEAS